MEVVEASTGLESSERAELEWLLESGALGRSANLTKVLRYICEETAAGRADQIKEYSIAVDALGRRPEFDPQNDTIVRVTIHTLRKRLQELYDSGEAALHAVRVMIPAGGYAAQFLHIRDAAQAAPQPGTLQDEDRPTKPAVPERVRASSWTGGSWLWLCASVAVVVIVASLWRNTRIGATHAKSAFLSSAPLIISQPTHILLGQGRHAYTDHSGIQWAPQPACEGGEVVPSVGAVISGTEDSYIYDGGIRGIVRCTFRARPGFYELRLHFAEPSSLEPAQRVVTVAVNAGPTQSIDVVDRSGGDHAATTFIIPGVSPENDGTIHVDFTSEVSPVNAVEILPAETVQPLPLRIVASSRSYTDEHGNLWLSDRYFRGGRHGQPPDQEHRPSLGLYASNRVGTFQYSLPAPAGNRYRVTLYFREAWFGQTNGAPGGAGSRVFNVYCNGEAVLRDFDILADGHGSSVAKRIDVSPTAQGELDLQFVPVVNYPMVNAIEVTAEQP